MLLDAFSISSGVKGVFILVGFMILGSSAVTAVNMFLKMFSYYVGLFFFRCGIHHVFPVYNEGFLWFVAVYDSYCLIAFIGIAVVCFNVY